MAARRMEKPVCLIESDSEGRLRMVSEALEILQQMEQKVVVVSVVGLYRTGKSYLMNKLAGSNKGFPLGSTVQAKTKGIWMWCVPHPGKTDHTLVLLDTEGLGDVKKGDTKNDNWIFAMAVLLSSTLVYNSMGTIDNKSMENLHYVTELTKNIKIKSKEKDDDRTIVRYLPSFVWTVRDFSLDLEIDEKPCTADEYLEDGLKEIQGGKPQFNEPRACLRKFFLSRHCFVFERPGKPNIMKQMEKMTDAELDPDFVEQANKFTEHIYTKSDTKYVGDGIKVTGRMLGQLAATYVKAIRSGEVPCLENAVVALAEVENAKAVEQARVLYVQGMEPVRFPTNTLEELTAIHASSERDALIHFMKRSFRDDNQEYQKRLVIVLKGEYNQIFEKNISESMKACGEIIKGVFEPLENKLGAGLYSVLGGYKMFCQDVKDMTDTYRRAEGKGVKAEVVLTSYIDKKAIVGKAILAADNSLSEAQRRAEAEKVRWEKAEREREAMELKQKALEVDMAQQRKTQEEHIQQLNAKMAKDKEDAADRHTKLMADFKEQSDKADEKEKLRLEEQKQALALQKQLDEEKIKGESEEAKWEEAVRERRAMEEKQLAQEAHIKQLNEQMAQDHHDAQDRHAKLLATLEKLAEKAEAQQEEKDRLEEEMQLLLEKEREEENIRLEAQRQALCMMQALAKQRELDEQKNRRSVMDWVLLAVPGVGLLNEILRANVANDDPGSLNEILRENVANDDPPTVINKADEDKDNKQ